MFPPLSSAWSLRIVRKLTRGSPCFTGLIGGYCSHWLRRLFRPHWAYFALFRPQGARFVRPRHCHPQFAMVVPRRAQSALAASLAHWAYYGLFPPQAAAFVRPLQFPLKSYGFPGCKEAIFALENGIFRRGVLRAHAPLNSHGRSASSHRSRLRRRGVPLRTTLRSVCSPLQPFGPPPLASSLAALPASLGLLRAVSPTGRALRAPPPYTPPGTIVLREGSGSRALSWVFGQPDFFGRSGASDVKSAVFPCNWRKYGYNERQSDEGNGFRKAFWQRAGGGCKPAKGGGAFHSGAVHEE